MAKKIYYRYNPETDDYERVFPSFTSRLMGFVRYLAGSILLASILLAGWFLIFDSPTEAVLRKENSELKSQYEVLASRLETSLKVMSEIQSRDDNFYRVMMQMDPLSRGERFAGLDNEARYRQLRNLDDNSLTLFLTRQIDLLDRQLYAQSKSFDQLRATASKQQQKLRHIPSIMPLNSKSFKVASGYGYRLDPVLGATRFHSGLDLAAPEGTPVIATADGMVSFSDWKAGYGNCIDLDHGFNYTTRFGNLSEVKVAHGQIVSRGDTIGLVGSTGKSSGPHLHYEVRFKDEPQNPVNYNFMGVTPDEFESMIRNAENAGHIMD